MSLFSLHQHLFSLYIKLLYGHETLYVSEIYLLSWYRHYFSHSYYFQLVAWSHAGVTPKGGLESWSQSDCSKQSGVFLPFNIFSCCSADVLRSNWRNLGFQSSNLHRAYFTNIYMLVNWRYGLKFSGLFPCNPVLDLY